MIHVLRELWAYRELAIVLAWRELVVRYKRSALGVLWALAEPLVMVGVYVVVFGIFLDAGGDAVENYAVFAMFGVLGWTFLSTTLEQSTTTFLEYAPFYKKVYFPRELLVIAVLVSRLSTLFVGLLLALGATAAVPGWRAAMVWSRLPWLLVGVAGMCAICLGLGVLLAALNALFRDTSFIVRFGLRLAFYACPVVYPLARVPDEARAILQFNPLAPLLWTFQGVSDANLAAPSPAAAASAAGLCALAGLGGWWLFRRVQWRVADVL